MLDGECWYFEGRVNVARALDPRESGLFALIEMQRTSADGPSSNYESGAGGASAKSSHGGTSRTPQSASTSFFIIQEPVISLSGTGLSPSQAEQQAQKQPSKKSRKKDRRGPSSLPLSRTPSRDEDKRLVASSSSGAILQGVHEEADWETNGEVYSEGRNTHKHASSSPPLSILNRVGSAPDLPLHSSVSAGVYSSSKKRNLMKSENPNGAGPHLVSLQRSRLIPLPINIRTGTLNREAFDRKPSHNNSVESHSHVPSSGLAVDQQQQIEDKANDDCVIASLKLRLTQMEKDVSKNFKVKHALEKQVSQLTKENQCVLSEKQQLVNKIEQLEKSVLQQKHAFEKLSDRYASVYSHLQKLTEQQASSSLENHTATVQSVLHALTKENQEFQRKLRVIEARHIEDKALAGNQEKKLKRLRAEMEALQHMNEANNRDDVSEVHSEYSYKSPADVKHLQTAPSPKVHGSTLASPQATKIGSPIRAAAQATVSASGLSHASGGSGSHLIGAEDYQYIDPNILKVLEKVDSQFSITNAINLSVVLKKWLNCCLHVTCSTHIPTVLQVMLKRICELLHCEHAALFQVDHAERKLTGKYSASGDVHWELPLDKGIIGYAARMNALCNVQRAYDDPRFYSSTDTITGIPSRELLCIPLVHELQPGQPHSVFAVLQAWNTTHQKPFTANDQILGSLLTIQAGTVFLQTQVAKTLQKINSKLLKILHMPQKIVEDESVSVYVPSESGGVLSPSSTTAVQLVFNAQTKLSECLGVKKLKIFVLDAEVMKIWHVGSEVDVNGQRVLVRKYSNVLSSLCGLVLKSASGLILEDPTSEATFNDTVDLKGGAGGMYLVPTMSPWESTPLGMIQVARSAKSSFHALPGVDPGFTATIAKEKQSAQASDDVLTMDLLDVFARVFAGLLHHVKAQQLYDTCPKEIQEARLAYLTDRLDCLESEYAKEQEEADEEEARLERTLAATAMMEQRILESAQRERTQSSHRRDRTPLYEASSEALGVEKDTVRRASFTEAIIQPQARSNLLDARRTSSAGSSRHIVTSRPALGSVASSPDALYGEPGHEEEDESLERLGATADAEDDRGLDERGDAEGPSDAITDIKSPDSVAQDPGDSGKQNLNDDGDENWTPDECGEPIEEQLRVAYASEGLGAEQEPDPSRQEAETAAFDADAYQMQPHDENAAWYGETSLYQEGRDDDIEGDREQQPDQPGDTASWLQKQESDQDSGLELDPTQDFQEPELTDGGDAFDPEVLQQDHLVNDGTPSDWQEGGETEDSMWRGSSEDPSPVGLISTDSMYAIDLNYSDGSPAEATNPSDNDSFSPVGEQADGESGRPS